MRIQLIGAFSIITRAAKMVELRTVDKTYNGAGAGFAALNHIDREIPTGLPFRSN